MSTHKIDPPLNSKSPLKDLHLPIINNKQSNNYKYSLNNDRIDANDESKITTSIDINTDIK